MQKEHDEHTDIGHQSRVHGPTACAKCRKQPSQQYGQQHAAQEPIGYDALEVFENGHEAPLVRFILMIAGYLRHSFTVSR